jgi:cysteine dioxygenase
MKTLPILDLEHTLTAEFARDARGPRVAQILGAYAKEHACWREFALFDPDIYTRNLIARNEWFELLVLCWQAGQSSPIHNHAGQNCWMAVLDGEIEELQFAAPSAGHAGPLAPGPCRAYVPGKVAFINDDIALHLVRPRGGQPGCSLHCYSRPIETCNVYEESSGRVVKRKLVYHSVRGQRVGA